MKRCYENAQQWLLLFFLPLNVKLEDEFCRPEDKIITAISFRLLHKDVCPLIRNVLLEKTFPNTNDCAMKCIQDPFCAGYNFRKKQLKKPNCQLTHTLHHKFNLCSKDDKGWNFYHPIAPRKVPCSKMKNCKNGGRTIIDLIDGPGSDPYRCECPKRFKGKLCEIDGIRDIFVSSSGNSDPGGKHAVIKVNGKDYSKNRRGFNFVVLDCETGVVEQQMSFDTYQSRGNVQDMIAFLNDISNKTKEIVIAAVSDEASRCMTKVAYDALSRIAGTQVENFQWRSSFALIGFSEKDKPSFVKKIQNQPGQGPRKKSLFHAVLKNYTF